MKKLIYIFLFVFVTLHAYSQNYQQGYIITNSHDTLHGLINNRVDKINMQQCQFKPSANAQPTTYKPGDIYGYRITDDGRFYITHTIEIEGVKQTVFLEYLVNGMMNLYYYIDDLPYFFFENEAGVLTAITQKPEYVDEQRKVISDNRYQGYLRYIFRDYQSIANNADKIAFNQKSLIGVVEEYHNEVCTTGEACVIFRNQKPDSFGIKAIFSAYVGVQYVDYKAHSSNSLWWSSENPYKSYTMFAPMVGGQLTLMNTRWSQSFGVVIDASVSAPITLKIPERSPKNKEEKKSTMLATSLRLGLKYQYPKLKIKPVVEAGCAFSYLFYLSGKDNTSKGYVYEVKQTHLFGLYAGIGADFPIKGGKSILLRAMYEAYPSTKSVTSGKDKMNTPHIKIGYIF